MSLSISAMDVTPMAKASVAVADVAGAAALPGRWPHTSARSSSTSLLTVTSGGDDRSVASAHDSSISPSSLLGTDRDFAASIVCSLLSSPPTQPHSHLISVRTLLSLLGPFR